jgi:glyceraldehyde 3-phosphate dehydrogenase
MRLAINGLGRIGRKVVKNLFDTPQVELIAINDIMPIDKAVYFLKYDSTYGLSPLDIRHNETHILINDVQVIYTSFKNILDLPWASFNIDLAINCSGTNKTKPQLKEYLNLGVKKVILSSPPDTDDIPIIIRGYNDDQYTISPIISNASCTTYCVAPILDIFHRNFGIEFVNFTTVHCYTADQNLQDAFHQDFRRSRAAGVNIIPTTTSATKVIRSIFPDLKDKVSGSSFRVPVINGSITEFIIELEKVPSREDLMALISEEAQIKYKGIIDVTKDKIVSTDVINCPLAALIDQNSIEIIGNKVKLTAFYDNEAGYSHQLVQLISNYE